MQIINIVHSKDGQIYILGDMPDKNIMNVLVKYDKTLDGLRNPSDIDSIKRQLTVQSATSVGYRRVES